MIGRTSSSVISSRTVEKICRSAALGAGIADAPVRDPGVDLVQLGWQRLDVAAGDLVAGAVEPRRGRAITGALRLTAGAGSGSRECSL